MTIPIDDIRTLVDHARWRNAVIAGYPHYHELELCEVAKRVQAWLDAMPQPDWSRAPTWAKYHTWSSQGACWWSHEPRADDIEGHWRYQNVYPEDWIMFEPHDDVACCEEYAPVHYKRASWYYDETPLPLGCDWRLTLTQRPAVWEEKGENNG